MPVRAGILKSLTAIVIVFDSLQETAAWVSVTVKSKKRDFVGVNVGCLKVILLSLVPGDQKYSEFSRQDRKVANYRMISIFSLITPLASFTLKIYMPEGRA